MLNRNIAPEYKEITDLHIKSPEKIVFPNGLEVYIIRAGSQELCKAELIFNAGLYYQPFSLVASLTNSFTEFGTGNFSAHELADRLDYHGAYFDFQCGHDFASLSLLSLNKHLKNTIPLFEDLVKTPSFPENEIEIQLDTKRQEFLVQSEKVNVMARRYFKPLLFGENNSYNDFTTLDSFNKINSGVLKTFYNSYYGSKNACLLLAGQFGDAEIELFKKAFGLNDWGNTRQVTTPVFKCHPQNNKIHFIEKNNAIQSAIRVGRQTFAKSHEDFPAFYFMNCLLGGYFGSRLMANIREDKGYTYGIGSNQLNLTHTGYFFISTEVGKDVTRAALDEIYFEINKLRTEAVSKDEIETVRNYLMGQMLHNIEGPFAQAESFKGVWEHKLGVDFYSKWVKVILKMNADSILEMANKYLQKEDLYELVVGSVKP
jgi:predicted Zn-dependent peptidase